MKDGVREPGQDSLANSAERQGRPSRMPGDVAEAAFYLIEEGAAEPGTPQVVEVSCFVQLKVGGFVELESRPARPGPSEDILSRR